MKIASLFAANAPLGSIGESELLNALPDGAYITDVNRKILFWNDAAERITGWRSSEVVGRSCQDSLLVHVDKDGNRLCGHDTCPLHRSIVTRQPSEEPLLVFAKCKSERRLPVEVSVAPITNAAGEVVGGIEIFRDERNSLQDLLRAKTIQDQSLACRLPPDHRVEFQMLYQPRDVVGGDFYQIEQLDEHRYGILIADAIGHGVAAALYTMQLRMLWADHHELLDQPAMFLRTINRQLHALVYEAGFFCTAAYLIYDSAAGLVRCVRAGHPSPLILRGADGQTETLGQSQSVLGMKPDTAYTEYQTRLTPGDRLLLYTDGATEIFDAHDALLDPEGLARLAREQMAGAADGSLDLKILAEKLLQYSNQIHLNDDLTLIQIHRLV